MNILSTLEESINLNRMNEATSIQVLNAFFSNYLSALLLLKAQDIEGLMIINDRSHSKLTSFSSSMSDVNYWGRVLFCSNQPEIKNRLAPGVGEELHKITKTISISAVHKMLEAPYTNPELVNWNLILSSIICLRYKFKYQSAYLNNILRAIQNWDNISVGNQQKSLSDAFLFLMQSDQSSKLLGWFRNNLNVARAKKSFKIIRVRRLHEDEGGGDGGAISTGNVASNAIVNPDSSPIQRQGGSDTDLSGLFKLVKLSPYQVTKKKDGKYNFHNGKVVVKRAKKFNSKKFKAPDYMKPVKKAEEKNENEV